jgi:hypothetical protein
MHKNMPISMFMLVEIKVLYILGGLLQDLCEEHCNFMLFKLKMLSKIHLPYHI